MPVVETLKDAMVLGLTSYNSIAGTIVPVGSSTPIPAATPITWTALTALDYSQLDGVYYQVTDLHSVGSTGGSLWRIDAAGNRPVLMGAPIRFSTIAAAPSPVLYPGLRICWTGGLGEPYLKSDGVVYRPEDPYIVLLNNLTDVVVNSGLGTEFKLKSVAIPRDVNDKSLLRDGDYVSIHLAIISKTGTADKLRRGIRFGQLNTTSDTAIAGPTDAGAAGNVSFIFRDIELTRVNSTTVKMRPITSTTSSTGESSAVAAVNITVTDIDKTTVSGGGPSYLSICSSLVTTTGDSNVTLSNCEIRLHRGY